MIRIFPYAMFHGKTEPTGSDFLRAYQLLKYWPEAGIYKYGENPEVMIFQKIFISRDYEFPAHFEGIKILDICDPMWNEGAAVLETCQKMDAVTCSTEHLAKFIRQFHANVHVIKDRFDLSLIPRPKKHSQPATKVAWFGYSHNSELLKPALKIIEELGLELRVMSNDDPFFNQYISKYKFFKYNEEKFYEYIQDCDFAILPDGFRPEDYFKSNNRTIKANLAGLPVATIKEEVENYIDPEIRQKWFDNNYANITKEYDVRESVKELKGIIDEIRTNRR